MPENIGDINLNINVNVKGAAGLTSINTALGNIQAVNAKVASSVGGVTSSFKRQSTEVNNLYSRLSNAEKQYDAIFRASYRLQNVGYGLINVSRRTIDVLKTLTNGWGDFEFTVNRAAGALQVFKGVGNSINPIYSALIENVYSLTKELRLFPAEDVAKATYFWASTSGQAVNSLRDLKSVMQSVNPLMRIAALTQVSYEQAIKGVYSILVQYHRPLSDVGDITAKLFVVTQRTALEFGDLIQAFKYVGPTANALGVSFEEVAKTLGAVGDAGIRGSQAGRALRQFFIQTVRPSEKAKEVLDGLFRSTVGLGKSFDELVFPSGKFIGITGYVNLLAKALQNASIHQRSLILASITTANELPVLTALVENQIRALHHAADAYDNTKASVDDAANAASQFQKAWDLLSNSWKGIVGRLQAGAEVIKLRVGSAIAESLKSSVDQLTKFLDKIELWVRRNPQIVAAVGSATAGLAALAGVAGGLFVLAGALLGLYAAIAVLSKGFGPLLAIGGAALGVISALAEAVVNNWTEIQRVIVPALHNLISALTGGTGTIKEFEDFWKSLHSTIQDAANFIVRVAIKSIRALLDVLTAIAKSPFIGFIKQIGQALLTAFAIRSIVGVIGLKNALIGLIIVITNFVAQLTGISRQFLAFAAAIAIIVIRAGGLIRVLTPILEIMSAIIVVVTAVRTAFAQALVAGLARSTAAAIAAAGGIRGLIVALKALSATTILVILTGIVLLLQQLGDQSEKTKQNIDDLNSSWDNFVFSLGSAGPAFQKTIDRLVELSTGATTDKIEKLKLELASIPNSPVAQLRFAAPIRQQIEELTARLAEGRSKYQTFFESLANETDHGTQEVVKFFLRIGPELFGKLDPKVAEDYAGKFTDLYFHALGEDGVLSAKEAIDLWNNAISQGLKIGISPRQFVERFVPLDQIKQYLDDRDAKAKLAEVAADLKSGSYNAAYAVLVGLKAGAANYSDDVNATVAKYLQGIPQGFSDVMDQVEPIVTEAPQKILDDFISGFKSLGSVKEKVRAALRHPITPKDIVGALIGDVSGGATRQALNSKFAQVNLIGLSALENAQTQFAQTIAAYDRTGKGDVLANQIRTSIDKTFGPGAFQKILTGVWAGKKLQKLTPEQKAGLQSFVDWAAGQLRLIQPSAGVLEGAAGALTTHAQQVFDKEFASEYGKPTTPTKPGAEDPFSAIVAQMRTSAANGQSVADSFSKYLTDAFDRTITYFSTHADPLSTLATGMSTYGLPAVYSVVDSATAYMANNLMGKSPPPMGPLSTIDIGGAKVIEAWAQGMASASGAAVAAVVGVVSSIAGVLINVGGYLISGQRAMKAYAIGILVAGGQTTNNVIAIGQGIINILSKLNLFSIGWHTMQTFRDGMQAYWILKALGQIGSWQSQIRADLSLNLYSGGWNTLKSWIDGMRGYWDAHGRDRINAILVSAKSVLQGGSPPPEGPLKNIDVGGFNVARAWVGGLLEGFSGAQREIAGPLSEISKVAGRPIPIMAVATKADAAVSDFVSSLNSARTLAQKPIVLPQPRPVSADLRVNAEQAQRSIAVFDTTVANARQMVVRPMDISVGVDRAKSGISDLLSSVMGVRESALEPIELPKPIAPPAVPIKVDTREAMANVSVLNANLAKTTAATIKPVVPTTIATESIAQPPIEHKVEKDHTVKVQVDVASKDGSVNQLDIKTLGGILAPELIRSLEHMSSVVN